MRGDWAPRSDGASDTVRDMDLTETAEQLAFRMEARTWLQANVPAVALPSFDTEEGFELHRQWERTLFEGRWSAVSWMLEIP